MSGRQTLPLLWLLSDARNDARLEDGLRALPEGSGFVYRHYHLPPAERRARFEKLANIAHSAGHRVVLAGTEEWGAEGRYGPADRLGAGGLRLATAHDAAQLRTAEDAGADGVFLSPVFSTASHPGAQVLGVEGFHALARNSSIPVIALGGMTRQRAEELGWPRWGAIDGLASTNIA